MCNIFRNFSTSKYFKIFQNISKYLKIFQNISKYFKIFQNISKYFKIFQNISKYFKIFQNISLFTRDTDASGYGCVSYVYLFYRKYVSAIFKMFFGIFSKLLTFLTYKKNYILVFEKKLVHPLRISANVLVGGYGYGMPPIFRNTAYFLTTGIKKLASHMAKIGSFIVEISL